MAMADRSSLSRDPIDVPKSGKAHTFLDYSWDFVNVSQMSADKMYVCSRTYRQISYWSSFGVNSKGIIIVHFVSYTCNLREVGVSVFRSSITLETTQSNTFAVAKLTSRFCCCTKSNGVEVCVCVCRWVILLKTGPKGVPLSRWNKNLTKIWHFLNYHYVSVVCSEKCHNGSIHHFLRCEPFWGENLDIFTAAIWDMALGYLADRRYFLGIIHDWIKTGFVRKNETSSYIQMVCVVCCEQFQTKER